LGQVHDRVDETMIELTAAREVAVVGEPVRDGPSLV
jgi:hypothetical protein